MFNENHICICCIKRGVKGLETCSNWETYFLSAFVCCFCGKLLLRQTTKSMTYEHLLNYLLILTTYVQQKGARVSIMLI